MSALSRRIGRSARAITGGEKLLEFFDLESSKKRIVDAADRGIPPVTSVSSALLDLASAENIDLKSTSVKQFIGKIVRVILEEQGYFLFEKGVRTPHDLVFSSGSTYSKKGKIKIEGSDVLRRMILALTDQEIDFVVELINGRKR